MRSAALKLYHRLPPFARQMVASARGLQLRRWRYGLDTDRLTTEAREREFWDEAQWHTWQGARLEQILTTAFEDVPGYRTCWQEQPRSSGQTRTPPALAEWPILTKQVLRDKPRVFVSGRIPFRRLKLEQTSGTTGTPLRLWHSRETARQWYALMEARWRGWYGLSRTDRWGILGGQLVAPLDQRKPPFWVWNAALNQLYLSSYHLSVSTVASYLNAIRDQRLVYLWGYASSLYSLAMFAQEAGLEAPALKVVISNAEPLYQHQRELIAKVFQCPVRDTYGMSEMVCGASECEHGTMHLWPEVGIYEVLRDNSAEPVAPGEAGRLVCTGLLNLDMPLIRYEVGDRVAIAPLDRKCPCGRRLPVLLSVEGRSDDVILTRDGRRIGRLDPVFKDQFPIREAQIIQESLDVLRVLVVPATGFSAHTEQQLVTALEQRLGTIRIQVEKVTAIPRTTNGKFRAVISKINPATAASGRGFAHV